MNKDTVAWATAVVFGVTETFVRTRSMRASGMVYDLMRLAKMYGPEITEQAAINVGVYIKETGAVPKNRKQFTRAVEFEAMMLANEMD